MTIKTLKSGCSSLDNALLGGVPFKYVAGIHGLPNIGKSILNLQYAFSFLQEEKDRKAVILETEGMPFLEETVNFLEKRFGLEGSIRNKRLIVEKVRGLASLIRHFGYNFSCDFSEDGKIEKVKIKEGKEKRKLEEVWTQVGFLSVDSITAPIKQLLLTETKNLPGRSEVENFLMGQMQILAEDHDMVVIVTNHTSINPIRPFDIGTLSGGTALRYNLKFLFQIMPPDKSLRDIYGDEARRILVNRLPFKKLTGEKIAVLLKEDYGFCDLKEIVNH